MESNNIITAPQVDGVHIFYPKWQQNHTGSQKAFYEFMTTPSVDRDEFINSLGDDVANAFNGGVVEVTLNENR